MVVILIIKMFKKLQQQNINNKNSQKSTSKTNSVSPAKRPNSYSAISRKKQNNSELYDYQIGNLGDHLFQGCFNKNKKHGEGVMILNTGIVVVGNWNKGKLNGYALFITPFGGKIHTNYLAGFLQGWVILQYGNSFEIIKYSQDKDQLLRRRYDESEQLWAEALYTSSGRLQKVLKIQKTKDFSLPSFVVDEKLKQLYDYIIMKGETNLKVNKIKAIKINDKFQYYGYVNGDETPNGLGAIFSSNQLYAGNFKSGSLDEEGLILFQNGLIYRGEIYSGKIWGNGAIYDINLDETKFVKVCQQGIEYILQQVEGYKINAVPFKMGKTITTPSDKGFSSAIDSLCQQITKYYFRSNSTFNSQDYSDESIISHHQSHQSRDSLDAQRSGYFQRSNASDSARNSEENYNTKKYNEKQAQRLELFSLKDINDNKHLNTTLATKINKSITPNRMTPTNEKNHNDDSLQFQMQQIKNPPANMLHSIPALTPTYDQISKGSKKVLYPHLLEFQMNKNVFSPCKFSKIGKIVNNSLKVAESLS